MQIENLIGSKLSGFLGGLYGVSRHLTLHFILAAWYSDLCWILRRNFHFMQTEFGMQLASFIEIAMVWLYFCSHKPYYMFYNKIVVSY